MKNVSNNDYHTQVLQLLRLSLTGVIVLILTACGGSDTQNTNNSDTTDLKIASALYLNVLTPDGFYKESIQADSFYSISHVKNTSLLDIVNRIGIADYELSSDDFVEAMAWSDKAAEYQPSHKQLAGNTETELYFEFTRFDPASPQIINIHRVFKASALDRSGVDRSDEDARYKGRITMPALTAEKVKFVVEYLWMFTLSNNYQNSVIESYTTETSSAFIHIMKQARLDFSYSDSCDSINVYEIRYTVPKDSGFIWREKTLMYTFAAKRTGSYMEVCD